VSEDEGRRKSSAVKIEIDHSSDECNVTCSKSDEVLSCAAAEDPQPKCADKPIPKPKYQIKEFVESASKLKFEIKNSGTTFNIYLPTLKKVVEVPEWEKVKCNFKSFPLINNFLQSGASETGAPQNCRRNELGPRAIATFPVRDGQPGRPDGHVRGQTPRQSGKGARHQRTAAAAGSRHRQGPDRTSAEVRPFQAARPQQETHRVPAHAKPQHRSQVQKINQKYYYLI